MHYCTAFWQRGCVCKNKSSLAGESTFWEVSTLITERNRFKNKKKLQL
jgi:hypothetical protein